MHLQIDSVIFKRFTASRFARPTALAAIFTSAAFIRTIALAEPATAPATRPAHHHIAYTPPANGSPRGTIGGGSRGGDDEHLPLPHLYAPAGHVGLTTHAQPSLYFSIDEATKNPVIITLLDTETKETIALPAPLDGIKTPGIQRFDVASTGASLRPGVTYVWSVAIKSLQGGPAHNAYCGAFLRYDEPAPALKEALAGKSAEEQAEVYSGNHIWFDTIAAEVQAIDASPGDPGLREQLQQTLDEGKRAAGSATIPQP